MNLLKQAGRWTGVMTFGAALLAGACHSTPTAPELLSLDVLRTARRIIPAQPAYLLLETAAVPQESDSPTLLRLFDQQGLFVAQMRLFGAVQRTAPDRIAINRSMDGWVSADQIGFLPVDYVPIPQVRKGGGNAGTYLVDSLTYRPATGAVDLFAKQPLKQFVTTPYDFKYDRHQLVEPVRLVVSLQDLHFYPAESDPQRFTITTWAAKDSLNTSTDYYFDNPSVWESLLQQVLISRRSSAPGGGRALAR